MATRFYDLGGTIARETDAGGVDIFDAPTGRWVSAPQIYGHLTGIGGDGDGIPITRDQASAILERLTRLAE